MTALEISLQIAIPAMWAVWIAYWVIAARNVKRSRWRESAWASARHDVPLLLCILLLVGGRWLPAILTRHLYPPGPTLPLAGAALVAAGLAFAIWARVHLGRNWSSKVVVKEDHSLVRDGPYRWVRHPIYTGMLLALFGTALAIGEWRGFLALACAAIGVLFRVCAEEARMGETFPQYAQYRRRTSALIPGIY
ncbi:MAG TPA: isoprenylcysteine carboxylmethyltransferase family protein [Stellaceae bacterium]|nr:isoprenylcysteine carboxylmethyltransferase family protein [Stellaceae bacterium]